jgi:hypothetical protein
MLLLLLLVVLGVAEGAVRMNEFGEVCPGKKPAEYVASTSITARNRIACVAACQRTDTCESVRYDNGVCTMLTSYHEPCDQRQPSTQQHLEKINSNWCAHGGSMRAYGTCWCQANFRGQHCQIGK